jgi:hypothetical protein
MDVLAIGLAREMKEKKLFSILGTDERNACCFPFVR